VSVSGGAFGALVHTDDATPADTALFSDFLTMERVFDYLQRAVSQRPAIFAATYDAGFGYPARVDLDGDRQIADDEVTLRIPALRTLRR